MRGANRRQQVLPPQRPQQICGRRRDEREQQIPGIRPPGLRPDFVHVRAAEKITQQPEREQENQDGT